MFKHILVPFDGSPMAEYAISSLLALAQAFDAKVSLIRVLERPQSDGCNRPLDPLEWQMCKVEARSYLDQLSDQLLKAGLEVEMVLEEGTAAGRIIEFVNAHDIDLIVASNPRAKWFYRMERWLCHAENHRSRSYLASDYSVLPKNPYQLGGVTV